MPCSASARNSAAHRRNRSASVGCGIGGLRSIPANSVLVSRSMAAFQAHLDIGPDGEEKECSIDVPLFVVDALLGRCLVQAAIRMVHHSAQFSAYTSCPEWIQSRRE